MRNHTPSALRNARKLRRQMSLPELLLWRHLRGKPLGVKFRKQHPIGNFVADFYCDAARTIIEIDGIAHEMGDRPERDIRRDDLLRTSGYTIIRIPAADVLRDSADVAEAIFAACQASPPPSAAGAAATSPGGGGFRSSVSWTS